ncbi:MAG: hypothetical protein ACK46X_03240 [Candidatus Sericytochromatia bacterium]
MRRHEIAWSPDTPPSGEPPTRETPDSSKPVERPADKSVENAGMGYGSQGPAAPPGVLEDPSNDQ